MWASSANLANGCFGAVSSAGPVAAFVAGADSWPSVGGVSGDEQLTAGLNAQTATPLGAAMSLNGDRDALAAYYAGWAATYDADVGGDDYGLPGSVAFTLDAVAESFPALASVELPVLDAGCGTGMIGTALARRGHTVIDGIDLSPEMTDVASGRDFDGRPVYRALDAPVDLTAPLPPKWVASTPIVVCGGVFTVGHVPPETLRAVVELVAPGGLLITTVRQGYFETTDYGVVSDALVASGAVELVTQFDALPYTADSTGRFYAYRVR